MIAQLLTFLFIAYCSFVLGITIRNSTNWQFSFLIDFLLGFTVCNALFTLISIFSPINEQVAYGFLAVILVVNIRYWVVVKGYFFCLRTRMRDSVIKNPVHAGLTSVFTLILFSRSLYNPTLHYDAGLYHLQSIKWISEYPTVIGLANINCIYGYNFNIFTWFAATSFQNLYGQPIYAVNFTLLFFFSIWLSFRLIRAIRENSYLTATGYLTVFFCLVTDFLPHVSTTTNNISIFILITTILASLGESGAQRYIFYPLTILSVYAVTSKLSAIPLLIVPLYAMVKGYFFSSKKEVLVTYFLCSIILLPWLAKNVLLTGWLLFPFPYINLFSFEWAVPKENVIKIAEIIKDFSKNGMVNAKYEWLSPWFTSQTNSDVFILILALVLFIIVSLSAIRKNAFISKKYFAGIMIALSGIIFTMYSAPSLAYCIGYFCLIIVIFTQILDGKIKINPYLFYTLGIILVMLFLKDNWFHPWHIAKNSSSRFINPYPVDPAETREFSYFLIDNKERCYYPVNSDQCFDHTLPCIPKRVTGLHLRNGDLEHGFFIDKNSVK